jgi:hypothetical protein
MLFWPFPWLLIVDYSSDIYRLMDVKYSTDPGSLFAKEKKSWVDGLDQNRLENYNALFTDRVNFSVPVF